MSSDLLDAYGWSGGPRPADGRLGRIVRVDRGEVDVVTDDGRIRVLSDSQRSQDLVAPATGDWVVVVDDIDLGPLVGRVLDLFDITHDLAIRWKGEQQGNDIRQAAPNHRNDP